MANTDGEDGLSTERASDATNSKSEFGSTTKDGTATGLTLRRKNGDILNFKRGLRGQFEVTSLYSGEPSGSFART